MAGSPFLGTNSWLRKPNTNPVATTEVATYENILQKAGIILAVAGAGIIAGWIVNIPALGTVSLIVSIILSFVIGFKRIVNPPLLFIETIFYGFGIGTLSRMIDAAYPGVVNQSLIGTVVVVALVYILYRFAKFRTTPKINKILTVALIGYAALNLVTLIGVMFGLPNWGWSSDIRIAGIPVGVLLGVFAIIMASVVLITDFESIDAAVINRQPASVGWFIGYGLVMTILWIYVELLRILSLLQSK